MPAPDRVPLGPSTVNRKWYVDVNTGTTAAPVWTPVRGINSFSPSREGNTEDDSDFDSGGFQSDTKTAEKWSAEMKLARKVTAASITAYDPGQEFLRLKSYGKMGLANSAEVRYYEMEQGGPRVEAYQGRCAVAFTEDGGGMTGLSTATCNLSGQGALFPIAHPDL
jgi:hypothetical protein